MRSTIKTVDLSRISESQTNIPESNYKKLASEIINVKYPVQPISAAQSLQERIDHFKNSKVKSELTKVLSFLNSYRQVRGDGNCFFRALGFTYLSNIQSTKIAKCFCFLKEVSLTCCYQKSIPKDFQKFYDDKFLSEVLVGQWEQAYEKQLKQNNNLHMKALLKLFNRYPFLDFIMVSYFRAVCLKALQKFKPQVKDFLDGSEEVSIRQYSQESQGIILDLCSRMLKIETHVYEVRKDKVSKYKWCNINSTPLTIIHLLFHDNHYDIVEKNENISAQISVLSINDEEYFTEVNEKLMKGQCIQCGVSGQIYEENGLCIRCYEASMSNLQSYKKEKYIKGKCNQCFQVKKQVSQTYGLCKDCIQIQNYYQNKKQNEPKYIKGKCQQCGFTQQIQVDFKLCKQCKNYQKRYTQKIYDTKSPQKMKSSNIKQQKIKGTCKGCNFPQNIFEDTKLCQECTAERMRKSNFHQKSKIIKMKCEGCKYPGEVHEDTKLCQDCTEKIKKSNLRPGQKKIRGKCLSCKYDEEIYEETKLCKDCTAQKQSKIYKQQKGTGRCGTCKQSKFIYQESRICQECLNKKAMAKSSIKAVSHIVPNNDPPKQNRNQFKSQIYTGGEKNEEEIACTKCSHKFQKKNRFGTTNNRCPYCKQIVRDNAISYNEMRCKKCDKFTTKRQNGYCVSCLPKKQSGLCKQCNRYTDGLTKYNMCYNCGL